MSTDTVGAYPRVEVTKAVVSVRALFVDKKAMTVAMFEQIPVACREECAAPDCLSLGVVRKRTVCDPACGEIHPSWALVIVPGPIPGRSSSPDPVLMRLPRYCGAEAILCIEHHEWNCKSPECAARESAIHAAAKRHFDAAQVYIATGKA